MKGNSHISRSWEHWYEKTRNVLFNCQKSVQWVKNQYQLYNNRQNRYNSIFSGNGTDCILYQKILYRKFLICQFYTGLTGISDKILIRYLSISILQFQNLIRYFPILILPMFLISHMPGRICGKHSSLPLSGAPYRNKVL